MIPFFFDTETYRTRPGRQAPRVVCVQVRDGADSIALREPGLDALERALRDPNRLIVGHGVAYDAAATSATRPRLLSLWIAAYRADRVTCTHEREKLIRIAQGSIGRYQRHPLDEVARRYKLATDYVDGDKDGDEDSVRLNYGALDGVPIERWPADATRYALADLVVGDVYRCQEEARAKGWLHDEFRQARGAFWLALTSSWGMRVDPRAAEEYGRILEIEFGDIRDLLTTGNPAALARFVDRYAEEHDLTPKDRAKLAELCVPFSGGLVRAIGSKDTKAAAARMRAVCKARGLDVPLTETGEKKRKEGIAFGPEEYTALDADSTLETGDPVLIAYSRFVSVGTLRSRVKRLRLAGEWGVPVQPRFDNLKETGRTSASTGGKLLPGVPPGRIGDSSQNLSRAPGLRECYVARPGCVILSVDWKAAELHTLGQTCLDLGLDSQLARILNSGKDVHTWFGGRVLGREYEWMAAALKGKHGPEAKDEAKRARQGAKAANFGFPGGLGIAKFRAYAAKTYQLLLSHDEAAALKAAWLEAFPEMRLYLAHIARLTDRGDPVIHFMSRRVRQEVTYCSGANSYFQGRAADMLKHAGFRMCEEIYERRIMIARPWNEAHDEILAEAPEERCHEEAMRLVEIMEEAGRVWCPDTPPKAEPAAQRHWRKAAEAVYRDGRLIPYEDRDLRPDEIATAKKLLDRGLSPLHASWVVGIEEPRLLEVVC